MTKRILAGSIVAFLIVLAGIFSSIIPGKAGFSDQQNYGGVSTCTGGVNDQVLSLPNVGSMNDLFGVTISWKVGTGCTNTGPTTVSVNGTLPQENIYRRNGGTLIQLGGAEMPAGDLIRATWDGTQFDLETDFTNGEIVGTEKIADYSTADPGYLLADGACVSETTYPALYAKIGTTHNTADGCTGSNFGLPDLRGRMPAGQDNMGGTAANRITNAVSGVTGTTLGAAGASQGIVGGITQAMLASFNLVFPETEAQFGRGSNPYDTAGLGQIPVVDITPNQQDGAILVPQTNIPTAGSGDTVPTLSPTQIVAYEIKL